MPLLCQQELHTQGFLDVAIGKNSEHSNLVSMEAKQRPSYTYPSVMISGI
jgi:hypothetical protein